MEYGRHILPSSLDSQDLSGVVGASRTRTPLSSAAGNAQPYKLASTIYHGGKGHQSRFDGDGHMYPLITVPSQPAQPSAGFNLHQRKQFNRHRREQKHARTFRNPIVDSPQYLAYRERATREGDAKDQKWPNILEDAFIEALLTIPYMQRRKFSYKGKPHGRNELIAEYLWIFYLQSLSPGERPDPDMKRSRKQVSSHIQVIKGFLKHHPLFNKIFPPKNTKPGNGVQEDSFKNDPVLRAISEGRLPSQKYNRFNEHQYVEDVPKATRTLRSGPARPCLFWLLTTRDSIPVNSERFNSLEDIHDANQVAHLFSSLSPEISRGSLDNIRGWQEKFPTLDNLRVMGDLSCDIIHMNVALDLMTENAADGAELCCRTELTIPGRAPDGCEWGIRTTFTKPPELCGDAILDPKIDRSEGGLAVMTMNNAETRFKIPFPCVAWAIAFNKLITIQDQYVQMRRSGVYDGNSIKSPRAYIEELSMYQELFCSAVIPSTGERTPFVRKAIILWTFHKTQQGEANHTSWRYIDAFPPRRVCMSPSPNRSHRAASSMYENFSSFVDQPYHQQQQQQQTSAMLDPYAAQSLATPPQTAGLQSPFNSQSYASFPNYDIPTENVSFISSKAGDSESTLVDDNNNTQATDTSQIDHYLAGTIASLADYDHTSGWHAAVSESFDTDPAWAGYSAAPNMGMGIWDTHSTPHASISGPSGEAAKALISQHDNDDWHDLSPSTSHHHHHQQQKQLTWANDDTSSTSPDKQPQQQQHNHHDQHDWLTESATSPGTNLADNHRRNSIAPATANYHNHSQQHPSMDATISPWLSSAHDRRGSAMPDLTGADSTKNNSVDVTDAAVANSILELGNAAGLRGLGMGLGLGKVMGAWGDEVVLGEDVGVVEVDVDGPGDGFDYAGLAERLT